jgi:hypothetical protein
VVLRSVAPEILFVVRLYDGMDNQWIDVSPPASFEDACKVWLKETDGGAKNTSYNDIDYYRVFPADTKMIFSGGFGAH